MDLCRLLLSHEKTPAGDLCPGGRRVLPGLCQFPGISAEDHDRSLTG